MNFGKFWKCGFYDWRIVEIKDYGRLHPLELLGKPEPVFPVLHKKSSGNDDEEEDDVMGTTA